MNANSMSLLKRWYLAIWVSIAARTSALGEMKAVNWIGSAIESSCLTLASVMVLRLPAVQSASTLKRTERKPIRAMTATNSTPEVSCWMRICFF